MTAPDYSPDFEAFWKAYPKRDGQKRGKPDAFKVWVKMSAAEKKAADTDVGKRNRQHGWGKYIRDAVRYLRSRGWEDEWEPYSGGDEKAPPQRRDYHLMEPTPELSVAEIVMGRAFLKYATKAAFSMVGALPGIRRAIKIKSELLADVVPAFEEEIGAGTMTRIDANREIARAFLSRMDLDYQRSLSESIDLDAVLTWP